MPTHVCPPSQVALLMSGPDTQLLTNQEAATAWDEARREEHYAAQLHRVRITPALRTPAIDAYHEECRQKYLEWDPVKFKTLRRGECVLIECPRAACGFGTVDPELLLDHFDATDHYDPKVDVLDATTFNPVFAGEDPVHD